MAQKATIYKVELSVSDMDRHYYETHKLTVAKHPSETDERMMVRLLAFALNANEQLELTKGLSTDDEPDIWQKSLSGELDLWVALGLPSEKIIRQSCGKGKPQSSAFSNIQTSGRLDKGRASSWPASWPPTSPWAP